jgi:Cdc6-like AAA superfamily ATPase
MEGIQLLPRQFSILNTVSPARIPILGPGGIGKTATALVILHHEQVEKQFNQHRYFVSCEGAVTPSILLSQIMQVFGLQPKESDDAFKVLHAKLTSLGPLLLVLDNFETPWMESGAQTKVGDILHRIASIMEVSIILTMRGSTPPFRIQWTQLENFPPLLQLHPDAAKAIFLAVNPMSLDSKSEQDLVILLQEMDHMPLAVILVAQLSTGGLVNIF